MEVTYGMHVMLVPGLPCRHTADSSVQHPGGSVGNHSPCHLKRQGFESLRRRQQRDKLQGVGTSLAN